MPVWNLSKYFLQNVLILSHQHFGAEKILTEIFCIFCPWSFSPILLARSLVAVFSSLSLNSSLVILNQVVPVPFFLFSCSQYSWPGKSRFFFFHFHYFFNSIVHDYIFMVNICRFCLLPYWFFGLQIFVLIFNSSWFLIMCFLWLIWLISS